jgi:peptidyl-prolyl cis-trans isomerase D
MLDVMRSNARSSLIVIIFGAIIVTFIFSFGRGSSGFRTRTPETWAATVNGDLVTAGDFAQAYAQRFRQSAGARGGKYTTDDAKRDDLRRQTLRALEDQQLIAQQAKDIGIAVSDSELSEAISHSAQFQQEGKFDFEYYKRLVENGYGMSVPRFEDALRRDLLRAKVVQAALNGATLSDDEVKAFYIAQHESASMDWVRFTGFMFRDQVQPSEPEIAAYIKDHAKEIEDAYNKDKDTRYKQAAAVKVRAVTVPLPPGSTPEQEQAAQKRIDAALAEVKAGKDFAQVAKEKSEDTSTKIQGGDLGFVARGGSPYGATLEEQALKLKPGEASAVFKDRAGFHILKAEERREESVKPLDEVKKQIAADKLRADKSLALAKEKAQQALTQVKSGKSLKDLYPAKKQEPGQFDMSSFLTPQTQTTEPFHPMGGYVPGIGLAPKLSEAVFSLSKPGDTPTAPIDEGDTAYVFATKTRERADPTKMTDAEKTDLRQRLEVQKQNELYQTWLDQLRKKSRVEENQAVLSYEGQIGHETLNPDEE